MLQLDKMVCSIFRLICDSRSQETWSCNFTYGDYKICKSTILLLLRSLENIFFFKKAKIQNLLKLLPGYSKKPADNSNIRIFRFFSIKLHRASRVEWSRINSKLKYMRYLTEARWRRAKYKLSIMFLRR